MDRIEQRKDIRTRRQKLFQFASLGADADQQPSQSGFLVDYSIAGIRFVTNQPLAKNTPLLITLDLDGLDSHDQDWRELWEAGAADQLNIIGSVMWCLGSDHELGRYEVGTRFTGRAG